MAARFRLDATLGDGLPRFNAGGTLLALRSRAQRLLVVRGGTVMSRVASVTAELNLPGRPAHVDFTRQAVPMGPVRAG